MSEESISFDYQSSSSSPANYNFLPSTQLNEDLLQKLLDDDVNNEETLFELIDREDFPKFVLSKDHVNDDYLVGLTNLIRRLMKIHDEVINNWIGLELVNDNKIVSIFTLIFDLIEDHFEYICYPQFVEYYNLSFSLYDYVASILCSFIMTFNEEQIIFVEDFLFENLFSPILIKALIASDIFCFMCRTSKSFTSEISEVLFKILGEIFFEDVKTSKKHESCLHNLYLTKQILLNLCKRILKFTNDEEIVKLAKLTSPSSNLSLWNNFDFKIVDNIVPSIHENFIPYEELFFISKFPNDLRSSIISPVVNNFVNISNEYEVLVHLRIFKNLKFLLNYPEFSKIILKIKSIFDSKILFHYRLEFCLNVLKLLNCLAFTTDKKFTNYSFITNLYQLSLILFQECYDNFVSKLYYFSSIQNICSNPLFTNLLVLLSRESRIKTYLKFNIKYVMAKECLFHDEKDIYVRQMKDAYNQSKIEDMINVDEEDKEIYIEDFFFEHFENENFNQIIKNTKNVTNNLGKNNGNDDLLKEFCSFVEKMKMIQFISESEKKEFLSLSNKLTEVITKNGMA